MRHRPPFWLAVPFVLLGSVGLAQTPAAPPAGDLPDAPAQPPAEPGDGLPSRTIRTPLHNTTGAHAALLTVDQDLLFVRSAWGKRASATTDAELGKIAADNDRLAAQLSDEEADLTKQRATLDPAEFRRRADAFDLRATQVRRERAQLLQNLNAWAEADRAAFYRAALPIMGDMMQERGAVAVLDRRTVFVALDAIDMTDDLVTVLDQQLGDGAGVVPMDLTPAATAPDGTATTPTPPKPAP